MVSFSHLSIIFQCELAWNSSTVFFACAKLLFSCFRSRVLLLIGLCYLLDLNTFSSLFCFSSFHVMGIQSGEGRRKGAVGLLGVGASLVLVRVFLGAQVLCYAGG
ncbi:hypothetical protein Cni_G21106 [Canna indica]|uniref:Uncharacterized protein n=1 Tax=Canna indica TaxID=4628 RepID=A0AAQ3KPL0_9LILI|nr:hypothetical protein Cni_G21106 [Canna indica]